MQTNFMRISYLHSHSHSVVMYHLNGVGANIYYDNDMAFLKIAYNIFFRVDQFSLELSLFWRGFLSMVFEIVTSDLPYCMIENRVFVQTTERSSFIGRWMHLFP